MASLSFTAPRLEIKDWEKELESMTTEEKAQALQDYYGKVVAFEENPDKIRAATEELELHLDNEEGNQEFLEARRRIPEYVDSIEFQLMFLRAEAFNAESAAKKMVKYWKFKVKLFGEDIAYRTGGKILLSDLSEDDLATLDALGMTWLPKDGADRGVIFSRRQNWVCRQRENLSRLGWYLVHVGLEDVSIQKNGVVLIGYNVGQFSIRDHFNSKSTNLMLQTLGQALPMRIVGIHHCFSSKIYKIIIPFTLYQLGKQNRARLRLHFNEADILSELAECGISKEALPVVTGGQLEIDPDKWKADRRRLESG